MWERRKSGPRGGEESEDSGIREESGGYSLLLYFSPFVFILFYIFFLFFYFKFTSRKFKYISPVVLIRF